VHVLLAHVDLALHAKERAGSGGRHAMLARAGLRDDARLPHAARQERLPNRIVDFMCPGVAEVFPLEVDFGTTEFLREALGKIERCWAAYIRGKVVV